MGCSYNFRRVLIEVVTSEDLQTIENRNAMITHLSDSSHMGAQIVRMYVLNREDTLEQISCGPQPCFLNQRVEEVFDDRSDDRPSLTHHDALEYACVAMGMEPMDQQMAE